MERTYQYAHIRHFDWGHILRVGVTGGLIAAVAMMLGEMVITLVMGMDILMPPRMMAGILLGPGALDPAQVDVMSAMLAGMMVHLVLSMIYGIILATVVAAVPALGTIGSILLGLVFGLALWVVNFYIIAPAAGWSWFPQDTDPLVQSSLHAVTFGTALGWYVGAFLKRERA